MAELELDGRSAIVTGGASGIGRATSHVLARRGARVCVADLNVSGAETVAKEIEAAGGEAFHHAVDVTDVEQNEALVRGVCERFGRLDLAHLNAGIGAVGSTILDGSVEDWDRVISVNLRGVFLGMRAVSRVMAEAGGGAIVATASVAGLLGGPGQPSYYASKHAVVGLVKAAAVELAPHGIRVNAVCPGVIDTPILGDAHGQPEMTEGPLAAMHLLNRVGQPEEVGELVAFLCSDRAAFLTGAAYPIDGGMSASVAIAASDESLIMERLRPPE